MSGSLLCQALRLSRPLSTPLRSCPILLVHSRPISTSPFSVLALNPPNQSSKFPPGQFRRNYSDDKTSELERLEKEGKLSLSQRFKLQFKRYWYVLVPVHVATSVVWFGGFYLMCKSGVDVSSILSTLGASETYVAKLKDSDLGYYAMAYACYKVATPIRYKITSSYE